MTAESAGRLDPTLAVGDPDGQHVENVGPLEPTVHVLYCSCCNAVFPSGQGGCPRCGTAASNENGDRLAAETMMSHDDVVFDRGQSAVLVENRLDGQTLHVYECEKLIGRGGMGHVYLAKHLELHRRCALKILSPQTESDDIDYVQRFMAEGRSAAALVHPNIVTVHAIGESEGNHFLEMEFVAGRSLQNLIDREGALTSVRATVLAGQIAEGLSMAHRHDILHRDLKPDNVLLSDHGTPKIADFGLAKRVRTSDKEGQLLCGTPHFMAPELLGGEPATPASDVYALGVCYFLMLTGQLPFKADSFNRLRQTVIEEDVPNVRDRDPDIPLEVAECVGQMLAKAPAARPEDGVAALQFLQAIGGQVRDVESLLRESFRGDDTITWSRVGERYQVDVKLRDGRKQRLYVEPSEHSAAERLLLIYSICCEARLDFYEEALRINARLPHGGLAIRTIDGRDMFVMIDTYPRGTVDAEEVRRSALEVAYRADAVEKELTGCDDH